MRLPFDPEKARGPGPEPGAARRDEAGCLTVSQLAGLIKDTLERRIESPLRVVGEVSNLSARQHWYFTLKDADAVVSCVAWASSARRFGFVPADGDQVLATGHVSHYTAGGRTQLYVSRLEPVGAGELERRFRAMCEELRGLGYFDPAARKPLPPFPRRIAVITSAAGAAVQDVISTAARRCPAVGLLIVDVRVQGEGAAAQVAGAIRWVDRHHRRLGVDAILLTRGGGSIEDLWAFNERVVADTVFACGLPVVAAIGHESDTTVAELVADARAATPTQAAMLLVPAAEDLARQVGHLEHRLAVLVTRQLDFGRQRLEAVRRHEIFVDPRRRLRRLAEHLDHQRRHLDNLLARRVAQQRARVERLAGSWAAVQGTMLVGASERRLAVLEDRLGRAAAAAIQQRRPRLERIESDLHRATRRRRAALGDRIAALERRLAAVDPVLVLKRGYSYTTTEDGSIMRSVQAAIDGATIVTHLADGTVRSVVGGRSRRRRGRGAAGKDRPQMDLFGGSE